MRSATLVAALGSIALVLPCGAQDTTSTLPAVTLALRQFLLSEGPQAGGQPAYDLRLDPQNSCTARLFIRTGGSGRGVAGTEERDQAVDFSRYAGEAVARPAGRGSFRVDFPGRYSRIEITFPSEDVAHRVAAALVRARDICKTMQKRG